MFSETTKSRTGIKAKTKGVSIEFYFLHAG